MSITKPRQFSHIHCTIITRTIVHSNNHGEPAGNKGTLKKIARNGDPNPYILYSGETIRFAARMAYANFEETNRHLDENDKNQWRRPDHWGEDGRLLIDDDLHGFMNAKSEEEAPPDGDEEAPATEEPAGKKPKGKPARRKNTSNIRRARIGHAPAISLTSWNGDWMFNAASPNATPMENTKKNVDPVPYGSEMHLSPFQYMFTLTPFKLQDSGRVRPAIEAHMSLGPVGGKQNTFHNDFSPESVIFRLTHEACPRIGYIFEPTKDGDSLRIPYTFPELLRLVEAGDIAAEELVIGGKIIDDPITAQLKRLGATVFPGVKAAGEEVIRRTLAEEK
jgi:CRISPR-associated protein Cst2